MFEKKTIIQWLRPTSTSLSVSKRGRNSATNLRNKSVVKVLDDDDPPAVFHLQRDSAKFGSGWKNIDVSNYLIIQCKVLKIIHWDFGIHEKTEGQREQTAVPGDSSAR